MTEKKVCYIHGAVIKVERKGDLFEVELYDNQGSYYCRKEIGMKVGAGYKFGIVDTSQKNRYEIVSIEQELIKEPAFRIKGPAGTKVQMTGEDHKELLYAKKFRIRAQSLTSATKICELTLDKSTPQKFMREVLKISKDLEPYFG